MLVDTGSMHGVYVNGRKILRTEIFHHDKIRFGSPVTRARGDSCRQPNLPSSTSILF